MPNYEMGTLIKKLRKQKGISQEDLAYPIIDRTTLSKIESGKSMPHLKTLEYLFERLGFNHNELINNFLAPEDMETQVLVHELSILLASVVSINPPEEKQIFCDKVTGLIGKLEGNHEYMAHPLNRQFILDAKARYAFSMNENEKAAILAKEALEIVIPNFCEKSTGSYHINKSCHNMINLLALIHSSAGCHNEAADILYGLKENNYNTYNEIQARAKFATPTIMNLAMALVNAGRAQEAYDICEEGIQLSIESRTHIFLAGIAWQQVRALLQLGKKEEGTQLARKVYWAFDLQRADFNKDFIRDFVLKETGVDVAAYYAPSE